MRNRAATLEMRASISALNDSVRQVSWDHVIGVAGLAHLVLVKGIDDVAALVVDAHGRDVETVDRGPDDLVHDLGLLLRAKLDGPVLDQRGDHEPGEELVADVLGQEQGELFLFFEQRLFRVFGDEQGQQQAETQNDDQQGPGYDLDELERPAAVVVMVEQ